MNKQLILRGIGMPVVNAGGYGSAITLAADGITLGGFTATRGGNFPEAGIKVTSNNNMLVGNNASNNNYSIYLSFSSNNTLIDNNASNTNGSGIYLYNSSNNTLSGNNANSNNYGSGIYLDSSSNNTLIGNNASNNDFGIYLDSSSNNTLVGNNASNTYIGIDLYSSSNNTLIGNNASNNDFGIDLYSSSNNMLSGNNANSNNGDGIDLYSSSNNALIGNNASSNHGLSGIRLDSSSNNKIYNNIFNNTNNFYFSGSNTNIWNTTRQSSPNIIGGPSLGGNFWAYPNGTGFSQTCTDNNNDGICDSPYALDANNTDYLPLASVPPPPSITGFAPESPVNNIAGESRTFNITADQTVNVTWYINGSEVFNETGVTDSVYTNSSAAEGVWNVTAIAGNDNGTASQEWTWIVTTPTPVPEPGFISGMTKFNNGTLAGGVTVIATNDSNPGQNFTAVSGTTPGVNLGSYVINIPGTALPGNYTIKAFLTGFIGSSVPGIYVTSGNTTVAQDLVLTEILFPTTKIDAISQNPIPADGVSTTVIMATVLDQHGNPLVFGDKHNGSIATVNFFLRNGTLDITTLGNGTFTGGVIEVDGVPLDANGQANVTLTSGLTSGNVVVFNNVSLPDANGQEVNASTIITYGQLAVQPDQIYTSVDGSVHQMLPI